MNKLALLVITGLALAVIGQAATGSPPYTRTTAQTCQYPQTIQTVTFDRTRYPDIYQHYLDAIAKGWPRTLILDRTGAATRRTRLLRPIITRPGQDRDEYPPAAAREGWLADVEYVPSSENRSQGASLGAQLRGVCDGVRFQYEWTTP